MAWSRYGGALWPMSQLTCRARTLVITRWLGWDPPTVENATAMIEESSAAWEADLGRYEFGMYDASIGEPVGICLANCLDPLLDEGEVNLAYVVFPEYRGQGLAGRAIELLCAWVATVAAADGTVVAAVLKIDLENEASKRVAAKHGFINVGTVETPTGVLDKFSRALRS